MKAIYRFYKGCLEKSLFYGGIQVKNCIVGILASPINQSRMQIYVSLRIDEHKPVLGLLLVIAF